LAAAPGHLCSKDYLRIQHRPLVAIDGVFVKPGQIFDAAYFRLLVIVSVAHVPVLTIRIASNHQKMIAVHVVEETVAHARRNDNHVSSADNGFDTPRVVLASKTEPRTASRDAQHLVSCTVEVRGVIHCIAPLRGDDANLADVRFDPVR
jgi:hypothetical protein